MTTNKTAKPDMYKIANEHGVDICPGANGRPCLQVQRLYQQGWPQDDERIARARKALEAAGISTAGWLS